jgi:tetratricopeptide (TPR) repeat protein/predicted membrane-bound spermidine synthase
MAGAEPKPKVGDWLIPNATVFIASGCVMIIEIVAGRVVSQHLGQSLYTWTSIIGIILAGISIGNYLGGRLSDRFDPRRTLAVMFVIGSATCLTIPAVNVAMGSLRILWDLTFPTRIVLHVTVTFLTPSVILGTISPLVAKMALARSRQVGRTIGDVYAWGAAGSIAGTFLAGFYLISWLGNTAVICVVSGVLALLAVFYGARMKGVYVWLVAYITVFAAAFGPGDAMASAGSALRLREPVDPEVVYLEESNYGRVLVREPEPGLRSMYLDKLLHTMVNINDPLDLRYEYTWIYEAITDAIVPAGEPIRAMIIGGGGFAYPHYLELVRPGSYIEVSEIDPEVTEAAFQAMGLPRDTSLKIFNTDARPRIQDLVNRKRAGKEVPSFQVIYGDSINDYSVPYHLTTREFNDGLYGLLDQDGAYILNLIDIAEIGHFMSSIVKTCRATFPHVEVFTRSNNMKARDTFIVVCTKEPRNFAPVVDRLREERRFRGALLSESTLQSIMDRSRSLVLTDNFAPVENLLTGVVRRDTGDALANYVRDAVKAANDGDLARAVKYFERALEISPRNPDLHFNMGIAYLQLGLPADAIQAFEAALESDPGHFDARRQIGTIYMQLNQIEKAIKHWRILKQFYPERSSVHYDLGHAFAALEQMKEATDHWVEAIRLEPTHAAAHDSLGTAYSLAGNPEEAIRHYEQAVKFDPLRTAARINLAHEFLDAGNPEDAVPHLRIALAQRPDLLAASNLLQRALKEQQNQGLPAEKVEKD